MSDKTRRQRIEEMLAETPDDTELRYMLAMEHTSEGDDEGAVRCFEELIRRDPDYPPAYHMAGRALVRLDRAGQARDLLQRGIAVARQRGDLHAAGEMSELLETIE